MYADQALMLETGQGCYLKSGKAFRQKNTVTHPEKYKANVEQSVSIVNMSRSSWYYKSRLNDSEIVTKLKRWLKHPNRGFENYYHRIRRKMGMCRIAVIGDGAVRPERRNVLSS
ncbi:MAG: hypothetical protein IPI53_00055 [Saprospiraceae bacterium]|nr:hypothetical protein [Saprospiraceae bacterium]